MSNERKLKVYSQTRTSNSIGYFSQTKYSEVELLETHSYRQVEEMTGISKSTLIRAKKELA